MRSETCSKWAGSATDRCGAAGFMVGCIEQIARAPRAMTNWSGGKMLHERRTFKKEELIIEKERKGKKYFYSKQAVHLRNHTIHVHVDLRVERSCCL